ncbi:MAG TPA: alcohol dehydrogenase catalytic domain-containing protein [Chthonomonadaceae bacterium]|nr:alcohol dehydrogenase catalytic domain-containing protein [Chthonomonadaceae bacterium]
MKALVFSDIRRVTMGAQPEPSPGPNEILLRVSATGICGSDMAGFLGHSPRRRPPLVLGHEAVGRVAAMPQNAPSDGGAWPFQLEQRVVVNPLMPCGRCAACATGKSNICAEWRLLGMDRVPGAFAEYVAVPARNVFPLPDDLPDERAVMIEPLANGVHLFSLIQKHNFGTLAIFGAGTQGCLMLCLARLLGYRDIAIVDINPRRLEVAQRLGAKITIDARQADPVTAVREGFDGAGVGIVIDAHGAQATRAACVGAAKKGAEILLLGLHEVQTALDFTAVVRNELRLQGSFAYTPADFAQAKKLIESGDVDLSSWTEARPLEEGQAAFDTLATDPGATMKILLKP